MGPTNKLQTSQVEVNLLQHSNTAIEEMVFKDEVKRFFHDDGLGVVTRIKRVMSNEDKKAEKMMVGSTRVVNGHYEIGMLWKVDNPQIPNNRDVALKRYQYLKTRLKRDENLNKKYQSKIEDTSKRDTRASYDPKKSIRLLRQFGIFPTILCITKPSLESIRIAAKFKGTSLNENLIHGPNLANEIVKVLFRFRKEQVAIAADVQEMFHQAKVLEKDRDSLRFLWSPNGVDDNPDEYCMNVHIWCQRFPLYC